ncbi:MAG: hypothetical protein V2B18_08980 [Pseudomonadota bacterium]
MAEDLVKKARELRAWLTGGGLGAAVLILIVLLIGVFMLWAASLLTPLTPSLVEPIQGIAKLFIVVIVVQILIRTWLWKTAIDTFFERLSIRDAILASGLSQFWWYHQVPWGELFEKSSEISVVAISARSLLQGHTIAEVKSFLSRPDTKFRVVLANPDCSELMAFYAGRFNETSQERAQKIRESVCELRKIANDTLAVGKVEIRHADQMPSYSCYRFDNTYLFVPYLTKSERSPERIPVLCFNDGSFVDHYLGYDLDFLLDKGSFVSQETNGTSCESGSTDDLAPTS